MEFFNFGPRIADANDMSGDIPMSFLMKEIFNFLRQRHDVVWHSEEMTYIERISVVLKQNLHKSQTSHASIIIIAWTSVLGKNFKLRVWEAKCETNCFRSDSAIIAW